MLNEFLNFRMKYLKKEKLLHMRMEGCYTHFAQVHLHICDQ